MALARNLATSFVLAAATTFGGDALAHNVPPIAPPSINTKSERDRIPLLMLKLYDLNRETYEKALEVGEVRPKQKLNTDKVEIHAEITDKAEREKVSKDFGVGAEKVRKIAVKSDGVVSTYYFMSEGDVVYATATATQLELEKPANEKDDIQRVFWTTHIPESQKVLFGYKEESPSENKALKWNTIEVAYDERKNELLTFRKTSANAVETLGSHPVPAVEKQLSPISKAAMSPSR